MRFMKEQSGFTLIEMLVAMAITGLIGFTIAMAISQTVSTSARNREHTTATKQIQNTIYWVRRDAKMAQVVTVDGGGSGLPLSLRWTDWDTTEHMVTYAVEGDSLKRSHAIDGGEPTVLYVARPINTDPSLTNCSYDAGVINFRLTAIVGEGARATSQTAIFNIDPRASP